MSPDPVCCYVLVTCYHINVAEVSICPLLPPQRAEEFVGEVCCYGSELQADCRTEGFLLQDGGGCSDDAG